MKKLTYTAFALSIIVGATLSSCGGGAKEEKKETKTETTAEAPEAKEEVKEEATPVAAAVSGEDVFTSKGCVACHQADTKTVGPAIKEIGAAYADNKEGLIAFFKEEAEAIVDPAQAAIMKPQLAVTKALPAEELDALADYMINL